MKILHSNPSVIHTYFYRCPPNLGKSILAIKDIASHSPSYALKPRAHTVRFAEAVIREDEMNSQLLIMTYAED